MSLRRGPRGPPRRPEHRQAPPARGGRGGRRRGDPPLVRLPASRRRGAARDAAARVEPGSWRSRSPGPS
ncbi:hypothetical protein [Nocardioides convexus]|uniref:hypothetical protein n=1 Tax=Nocardioides convexus TaxID=2712224 RepID=UPI003100FABC